jgi:aspartyl-tRNA(Asn)/glutamyl-tRNA(Gln) amidotransferase subunit A
MSRKDLTDTAGIRTTFASQLLSDRVPDEDALLLKRAARAGMVCIGKTTLSEFAYSGLGINPHFGTPSSQGGGNDARVPGGSSSGAAVSVANGLAPAGIGSDTGGSVRIPAAYNGLVGLKTTIGQLPLDGILALSPTFDTIGPLTKDVADANVIFAILDASPAYDLAGASLKGVRLLKPTTIAFDDLDETVSSAMAVALDKLANAGAEIVEAEVPEFSAAFDLVAKHGNIISAEGYAMWGDLFDSRSDEMYTGILDRFRLAKNLSAIDEERAQIGVRALQKAYAKRVAGYQAVVLPTAISVPPRISDLIDDDEAYDRANLASSRNTRLGNLMKTCGVTLPCQPADELPVGLQLMGRAHEEGKILRLAAAAEQALA